MYRYRVFKRSFEVLISVKARVFYAPVPPFDGEEQRRPWSTALYVSVIVPVLSVKIRDGDTYGDRWCSTCQSSQQKRR